MRIDLAGLLRCWLYEAVSAFVVMWWFIFFMVSVRVCSEGFGSGEWCLEAKGSVLESEHGW